MKISFLLCFLSVMLMGCSSTGTVNADTLKYSSWQFVPKDTGAKHEPIRIEFLDAFRVNGFAGCNRFFGQGEVKEGQLFVSDIGMTRKLCDPATNEHEQAFLNMLQIGVPLQHSQNELVLLGDSKWHFKLVKGHFD
ncbi:META domain-containing protein [Pseudoalteromonas obscura]|uniref:META domain-containing protein n=1 Tax=Pseudoalteromonas obscura TaxID=3048491 RepID=A0ABT7EPW8_9GAMM|nr:META domain-containing protein [Pseudoalteromonas sp. P94(2023)]MDK2597099.1 META domain-containing protein [Pseudoalteromonas sp. P94(2023)]